MSVRVESWDKEKSVLWLIYEGRGDELEANLHFYCIDYVSSKAFSTRTGWIGICYRPGMSDTERNLFLDSAIKVVELLTARSGITHEQERRFAGHVSTVQAYQCSAAEVGKEEA
jgi:hypothetical protein